MNERTLYRIPTCAARDRGKAACTYWYTYVRAYDAHTALQRAIRADWDGFVHGTPEPVDEPEPGAEVLE